jgi:hypothetical protein
MFRYRAAPGWSKADPDSVPVNNCHEMVMASDGRLYLLTDHPQNNVLIYGLDGNILGWWTLGSKAAHGLTLSCAGGKETLWISDSYNGRVINTTLTGTVLRVLPTPHQLKIYKPLMPYVPTQTAVGPNGDVYVADGYGSQFIVQFDVQGRFVRHFGGKGRDAHHLNEAHGIAIDDRRGPGGERLLVTSRRDSCIKEFDLEGRHIGDIPLPGGYPCRPVLVGDYVFVSLCWSQSFLRPNSGFVIVLDSQNQVVSTIGGQADRGPEGTLVNLRSDSAHFCHVHDICVDFEGNAYVCQWNAGRIYPLKLHRISEPAFEARG